MNLFRKTSLTELQQLLSKTDKNTPVHNIVIDYDGEVLIDPQLSQPEIDLNKFKYRVQLSTLGKDYLKRSSTFMQSLMQQLLFGWQGKGHRNFNLQ